MPLATDRIPGSGLFERVQGLMELVLQIPDDLSDEEARGVIDVMPPDVADTLEAFLIAGAQLVGVDAEGVGSEQRAARGEQAPEDPLDVLAEVGPARPHLSVDAWLDFAREEGVADKFPSPPRAVPVPSHPPNALADQAHCTARLVTRRVEAQFS